jgi:hypothetical protein
MGVSVPGSLVGKFGAHNLYFNSLQALNGTKQVPDEVMFSLQMTCGKLLSRPAHKCY